MNELSTKVKKLNILQKIKLEYYVRKSAKNLDIDTFLELPEYIQSNGRIVCNLINRGIPDEELRRINPQYILHLVNDERDFFSGYSTQEKYEILKSGIFIIAAWDDETKIKLACELIDNGNGDIIESILSFSNLSESLLSIYEEQGRMDTILPVLSPVLKMKQIQQLINENPKNINFLAEEQQMNLIQQNSNLFELLSKERQMEIVFNDISMFDYASVEVKKELIKNNPNMYNEINEKSKIELVRYDARLYDFLPDEAKKRIVEEYKSDESCLKALIRIIRADPKKIKIIGNNVGKELSNLFKAFDGLENESTEKIVNFILHSKLYSAIGSLTSKDYKLHGFSGGTIHGIDGYDTSQIQFIHKLSSEQISQLIDIDVNYVLPYLTGDEIQTISSNERVISQKRCEELFANFFGNDQYMQYSECIQLIYDMQMKQNDLIRNSSKEENNAGTVDFDLLKLAGNIPLEELKVLFNKRIIYSSTPEQIKEYLLEKSKGNNANEQFIEIIGRAYGERAVAILESRPQLDVHSINSLEVFDERILSKYGESFVHDCITYNFRDFSEFLQVAKDEKQNQRFFEYYEVLATIYGRNAETMQRAMSEYSYVKDLLQSVGDKELTGKQGMNLIKVLCSSRNQFDINSIQELENYDELANKKLEEEIQDACNSIDDNNMRTKIIRKIICENVLGMLCEVEDASSGHVSQYTGYGVDIQILTSLYDFEGNESRNEIYSEQEKRIMQIINFIAKEQDPNRLIEFARNTQQIDILRNPVTLNHLFDKVMENEINELNQNITSIETIREMCEKESGKEEPSAYYEERDGLQIYHLNGMPYCIFAHDKGKISNEDLFMYEGQAGNTAICTRITTSNKENSRLDGLYLYGQLPQRTLIGTSAGIGYDAQTSQAAKRVKNAAEVEKSAKDIPNINGTYGNEVSFYRRYREHSMIDNANNGGRIRPMAYGASSVESISPQDIEFFKANGIPIIVLHKDKYIENETEQIQDNEKMERE